MVSVCFRFPKLSTVPVSEQVWFGSVLVPKFDIIIGCAKHLMLGMNIIVIYWCNALGLRVKYCTILKNNTAFQLFNWWLSFGNIGNNTMKYYFDGRKISRGLEEVLYFITTRFVYSVVIVNFINTVHLLFLLPMNVTNLYL